MHFRILEFLKLQLNSNLKASKSAANCIGILMRRPELQNKKCNETLLNWVFSQITIECMKVSPHNGYLVSLFKVVKTLVKEQPRELCVELFPQIERYIGEGLEGAKQNEAQTIQYAKMKAYIQLFEKVVNRGGKRRLYCAKKVILMENIDASLVVPMITNESKFQKGKVLLIDK